MITLGRMHLNYKSDSLMHRRHHVIALCTYVITRERCLQSCNHDCNFPNWRYTAKLADSDETNGKVAVWRELGRQATGRGQARAKCAAARSTCRSTANSEKAPSWQGLPTGGRRLTTANADIYIRTGGP